jgi:hypothetical protein
VTGGVSGGRAERAAPLLGGLPRVGGGRRIACPVSRVRVTLRVAALDLGNGLLLARLIVLVVAPPPPLVAFSALRLAGLFFVFFFALLLGLALLALLFQVALLNDHGRTVLIRERRSPSVADNDGRRGLDDARLLPRLRARAEHEVAQTETNDNYQKGHKGVFENGRFGFHDARSSSE